MKSKQLFYFADNSDLISIIKQFETICSVEYFKMGMFDVPSPIHLLSLLEYKELGFVSNGDWNQTANFLVIKKGMSLKIREIPQKKGGFKYAIDQLNNPSSVIFKIGGVFNPGVLVAGSISTVSESQDSLLFFNQFQSLIKKEYKKIGTFYVGKNAEQQLKSGWRLVTNEKSPREYDLIL